MPKKILVVTKDGAEFQIYFILVALLRALGHTVMVVAEGLSLAKWIDAGEVGYYGQSDSSSQIDAYVVFEDFSPDLVLTGLGAPINLGRRFGIVANQRGIKLGYVEDVHGVHSRSDAVPDFVCTLDDFGASRISSHTPYLQRMPRIFVTGNPFWDSLTKVPVDLWLADICEQFDETILLAGQDESTTPLIIGLVAALDSRKSRSLIIPRLHPKFMTREDLVVPWLVTLAKSKSHVLWVPPGISIQTIMRSVKTTVSIYSNVLTEAAMLGSVPVSWTSDIGREKMRAALGGIERIPLVDSGCAAEVSTPDEFLTFLGGPKDEFRRKCAANYRNDGKNAQRVVDAIVAELN